MEEFKPNSHKSKENKSNENSQKVNKAVIGKTKMKKKSELKKFADIFISEDINDVKSYILLDVLVPAIREAIWDIVTNGLSILLNIETDKKKSLASKVSYRNFYDEDKKRDYNTPSTRRGGFDYNDILFDSYEDAAAVLEAMNDIIDQYGVVTVGAVYDLANISNNNYTANKYGWTDIRVCKPVRVRDGYILKLPRALPID